MVHDALASGRLASGPIVERFEREMAERYGAPLRDCDVERHRGAAHVDDRFSAFRTAIS